MTRVVGKAKGSVRFNLIQWHRLAEYERALDACIEGKVSPAVVTKRAKKLKEVRRGKL